MEYINFYILYVLVLVSLLIKMTYSSSSIILSCAVVFLTYWAYRFVNWIWLKPKKLEKCLREQGFKGNPYRLLKGDKEESLKLIREAESKPIQLSDDIEQRVIPHVLHTIKKHGVKSFMWEGRIPRVLITDPELIREVLNKHNTFRKTIHDQDPATKLIITGITLLDDNKWSSRRRILNASFQFEKLKLMLPRFYLSCLDMSTKWENKIAENGGSVEVEVHHDLQALSGDILARTLFGSSFQECEKIFQLLDELMVLVSKTIRSVSIPGQRFLPTKNNNRMKQINKDVHELVMRFVNKKIKALNDGETGDGDFLGILLEYNMNQPKNDNISVEEIIDECKLFFFAGQDTTALLFTWTLLLLSTNPEWQKRAREEVLQVFGGGEPEPTYEGLSQLKIVNMILYEALRLYPLAVEISKIVWEDVKIGDLFLPAGVHVMLPAVILHRDPEIWGEDAKEFKPERFSEGVSMAAKKQGTYFPFSLGPRICIGQNYTMLEAKMVLVLILRRFSFELSPSYLHAPHTLLNLRPQFGVPLILRKLQKTA